MNAAAHPLCEAGRRAFASHPALVGSSWQGDTFRFGSLRYLRPRDILSGLGSFKVGGRFNAPGSFPAVYASLDKATAATELDARARYYGLNTDALQPAVLVAVEMRLQASVDLRQPAVLAALSVTLDAIATCDWRAAQAAGREALTQGLGRAAYEAGLEALLVPSAQVPDGVNLVYFPGACRAGSTTRIHQDAELIRVAGS